MADNVAEMEWTNLPCGEWTEFHVSSWFKSIGIKDKYIEKLCEEEVTGPVLLSLKRKYLLETICMKSAQIEHLLLKRDELSMPEPTKMKIKNTQEKSTTEKNSTQLKSSDDPDESSAVSTHESKLKDVTSSENYSKDQTPKNESESGEKSLPCEFRKFDEDDKNFRYVKHRVLPPETGNENMIVPCHEYKSLEIAHKLESKKLKIKVAQEVLPFACACMNMRTNGTIHFGVMDKVTGIYRHGEIIGIPVANREDFVDALNYIESCFGDSDQKVEARKCIRNPKFIEVLDKNDCEEKKWVIEYDIVPQSRVVKDKFYSVCIPYQEKNNKVKHEDQANYHRVGANTPRIPKAELVRFIQGLREKDQEREEAESSDSQTNAVCKEDLKRKLSILLTGEKQCMDDSFSYIVVTNKFQPEHLESIDFLVHMKIFCVFDFDPDSKTSGLCETYKKSHATSLHFLHDYANDSGLSTADLIKQLMLFERTSWIFCNGRSDFSGDQETCDERTWIREKKKLLKKAVSVICNEILPKGSFVVLFFLVSQVEQPLVETFHEFYSEMNGHGYLTIISESKENYKKFSSLAQTSCSMTSLNEISIVGMPLSHVNATVQSIQLSVNRSTRQLPVLKGGLCDLKAVEEDMIHSLEIVSVDQCDDTNLEKMDGNKIKDIEQYFYHGGKIDWMNLWLADKKLCGEVIQRDAFRETNKILQDITSVPAKRSIESVQICHQPGSGGSTVARQILWSWRKEIRCAVVKQSNEISTVCEHALRLREYEERDKNSCLPVLLLLEDCNGEYLDDLRRELGNAVVTKKMNPSVLCFILLTCKRSCDPERMLRALPSQTVAVTHKISNNEKPLFSKKQEELELEFDTNFILTFVLMSKGFHRSYIEDFVKNLLDKIDHSSLITRLIRFVALFNCYIPDSYMSVSHCEASLGISMLVEKTRFYRFVESLSEEAKVIFIQLRESTNISTIRIIHPLVAGEILKHLSKNKPQSEIAMDLLKDKVLIEHKFDKEHFLKFVRTLFIRRNKKSKGDPEDSTFSPLIEHVITEKEGVQNAVDLLKEAYTSLGKDAFVAQQLARLLYTHTRFEEALHWAEEAKSQLPFDTFVLDTVGQVYKRWFYDMHDTLEEQVLEPENVSEIINIALKGITAFRASEKTPKKETVSLNSSYYGEVDVGCRLLQLLSKVNVFATKSGNDELMNYLLTEYIPEAVKKPWQKFHGLLKGLQKSIHHALECISEDLSYFQKDISEEDEELDTRELEQVHNPRKWLTRKSTVYASFFCNVSDVGMHTETVTPLQRQMRACKLGGGNVSSILSLFNDYKTDRSVSKLEEIIGMYPENLERNHIEETELVNFIFCQVALACTSPGSSKLLTLQKLQDLSRKFKTEGKYTSPASALFLVSVLFWPETNKEQITANSQVLVSAIDELQRLCEHKILHFPPRKSRTVTHFFLGKAGGLYKIVHRTAIEKHIKGTLSEKRLKWLGGEVWTNPEVMRLLKRVEGWTENGQLFVQADTNRSKIRVFPRYSASLPNANENVTFYLGFSFDGVVAFDIKVKE